LRGWEETSIDSHFLLPFLSLPRRSPLGITDMYTEGSLDDFLALNGPRRCVENRVCDLGAGVSTGRSESMALSLAPSHQPPWEFNITHLTTTPFAFMQPSTPPSISFIATIAIGSDNYRNIGLYSWVQLLHFCCQCCRHRRRLSHMSFALDAGRYELVSCPPLA